MKILAITMFIVAVSLGVINLQDLDFTELNPKSVECSQCLSQNQGPGLLKASAVPPPIRVQRKVWRPQQENRIKERPRRSS